MTEPIQISDANGAPIRTWQAWTRPTKPEHWAEGRSAMELARAWFASGEARTPGEITALLEGHALTRGLLLERGRPEHKTHLPPFNGRGPRHHDLWLTGRIAGRPVTVCIEGKADESFGTDTIQGRLRKTTSDSAMPRRIRELVHLIFGPRADPTSASYVSLQYQLLSGAGGTILQAAEDRSSLAVFIVHEFHSPKTTPQKLRKNAAALDAFVRLLPTATNAGRGLVGPIVIRQADYLPRGMDLLLGKAVRCGLPTGTCAVCDAADAAPHRHPT